MKNDIGAECINLLKCFYKLYRSLEYGVCAFLWNVAFYFAAAKAIYYNVQALYLR